MMMMMMMVTICSRRKGASEKMGGTIWETARTMMMGGDLLGCQQWSFSPVLGGLKCGGFGVGEENFTIMGVKMGGGFTTNQFAQVRSCQPGLRFLLILKKNRRWSLSQKKVPPFFWWWGVHLHFWGVKTHLQNFGGMGWQGTWCEHDMMPSEITLCSTFAMLGCTAWRNSAQPRKSRTKKAIQMMEQRGNDRSARRTCVLLIRLGLTSMAMSGFMLCVLASLPSWPSSNKSLPNVLNVG